MATPKRNRIEPQAAIVIHWTAVEHANTESDTTAPTSMVAYQQSAVRACLTPKRTMR